MKKNRIQKILSFRYIFAFAILLASFQFNFLKISSDFQFKTYRDGSEALILGKIFSDAHGINTGKSNTGFIEKETNTKSADVLSVYHRIDHPDSIVPTSLTDVNWTNGFSARENTFLIQIADVAELGYSSNELLLGQKLILPDEQTREITKLVRTGNFLNVSYSGAWINGLDLKQPYVISVADSRPYAYQAYTKQFGIQAITLSWLYRHIPFLNSVFALQFIMAVAAAAVLTLLIREYSLSISPMFGAVFFASMVGSPWIVAITRSLYWASFLWFLPVVIAMMLYRTEEKNGNKALLMALFCFAIFLKCLCGYEYISTIITLSLCIFLIDPFKEKPLFNVQDSLKTISKLVGLAVLGFLMAVLVHAYGRADTVLEGLGEIFGRDALKHSAFMSSSPNESPSVTLSFVISEYINDWKTPVLFWFESKNLFKAMLLLATISLAIQFFNKDKNFKRDSALLIFTALAPLSWLVLVPKHSAIHVHLNYVLWYFGFVPALVFVIIRGATQIAGIFRRVKIS